MYMKILNKVIRSKIVYNSCSIIIPLNLLAIPLLFLINRYIDCIRTCVFATLTVKDNEEDYRKQRTIKS